MARATLFDISTGAKKVVEAGSPNAFAVSPEESKKGITAWKLLTPTQTFETYKSPTKEITRGKGDQLYTSYGGVNTPISGPSQLASLVGQGGYQDTRRQLDIPVTSGGGSTVQGGGGTTQVGGGTTPSAGNTYQRFNDAVHQILLGMKGGNDSDLENQRSILMRSRFTTRSMPTPEELRVLTPEQQSSLREQGVSGIETQLGGVEAALKSRKTERKETFDNAIDLLDRANKAAQLGYEMSKDEKEQARKGHEFMITNFGSSYLDAMSPEEQKNLETTLGLGGGSLSKLGMTLKEQAQADKYPAGMVGEYQFFADQEKAAGRTPISFNEYQNIDANRKKSIARAGASTTIVGQNGVNMDDFRAEIARGVARLKSGESWSTVWPSIKALFPNASDKLIDDSLGKSQWYDYEKAYSSYKANQKSTDKVVVRETPEYFIYSDGSFEAKPQ